MRIRRRIDVDIAIRAQTFIEQLFIIACHFISDNHTFRNHRFELIYCMLMLQIKLAHCIMASANTVIGWFLFTSRKAYVACTKYVLEQHCVHHIGDRPRDTEVYTARKFHPSTTVSPAV